MLLATSRPLSVNSLPIQVVSPMCASQIAEANLTGGSCVRPRPLRRVTRRQM